MKDKKYHIVRNHYYYTGEHGGTAHGICSLKYSVPRNVPIVFHNRSNYDCQYIIKELVVEF